MVTREKIASGLYCLGIAVALASFFMPASPARGWALLAGFGLLAAPPVVGWISFGTRRYRRAYSTYMVTIATALSLNYLWHARPAWLEWALTSAMILSAAWFTTETFRSRNLALAGGAKARTVFGGLTRSQILFMGAVLLLLLLPLLIIR